MSKLFLLPARSVALLLFGCKKSRNTEPAQQLKTATVKYEVLCSNATYNKLTGDYTATSGQYIDANGTESGGANIVPYELK